MEGGAEAPSRACEAPSPGRKAPRVTDTAGMRLSQGSLFFIGDARRLPALIAGRRDTVQSGDMESGFRLLRRSDSAAHNTKCGNRRTDTGRASRAIPAARGVVSPRESAHGENSTR